jgi:hypothetical protein
MNQRTRPAAIVVFAVLLASSAAATCGGVAVIDGEEDTTSSGSSRPTTTTGGFTSTSVGPGTTGTTGPASSSSGGATLCEQGCADLFDCTQEPTEGGSTLCPGIGPGDEPGFMEGCIATCETSPALLALIDADDCPMTITSVSAVSEEFAAACEGPPPP